MQEHPDRPDPEQGNLKMPKAVIEDTTILDTRHTRPDTITTPGAAAC